MAIISCVSCVRRDFIFSGNPGDSFIAHLSAFAYLWKQRTGEDIERLKIIRSLRCADYSLEAILRMLSALEHDPQADIEQMLNTPKEDTDIISVCDRLIVSLQAAEKMIEILIDMKKKFSYLHFNTTLFFAVKIRATTAKGG